MEKNPILYPDDQVGFLLSQTYLLKQRVLGSALKVLDITYMQFVVLATILVLHDSKGWITQQDIADKRRLDKVTVSNVVKTLVQKGLIKRNHHPEDHRALIIRLTQRGVEIATKAKEIVRNTDREFFSTVDSEALCKVLKRLLTVNDNSIDSTRE